LSAKADVIGAHRLSFFSKRLERRLDSLQAVIVSDHETDHAGHQTLF
jgi:hypothetical protein